MLDPNPAVYLSTNYVFILSSIVCSTLPLDPVISLIKISGPSFNFNTIPITVSTVTTTNVVITTYFDLTTINKGGTYLIKL